MGILYEKTIRFAAPHGVKSAIELPAPARGVLRLLSFHQTLGAATSATFKVYDRRGACAILNDLNVEASGQVDSLTDQEGVLVITFTEPHNLVAGSVFELKGSAVAAYNTRHTVVTVVDESTIISDIAATASDSPAFGMWQTLPWKPTNSPECHLVHSASIATNEHYELALNRSYENQDNQTEVARCRNTALWLEFMPAGDVDTAWAINYICEQASVR